MKNLCLLQADFNTEELGMPMRSKTLRAAGHFVYGLQRWHHLQKVAPIRDTRLGSWCGPVGAAS